MALEASHKLNTVPEVVLKKRKRDEQWAATRRDLLQRIQGKNKNGQKRFEPFTRAEKLIKEYRKRVRGTRCLPIYLDDGECTSVNFYPDKF